MKKLVLSLLGVATLGAGLQSAKAGDREWAVAGKVLTGIAAASVISRALEPAPVYAYPPRYYTAYAPASRVVYAPAYVAPARVYLVRPVPVYVAPARPVVVYRAPVYVAPAPVVGFRFSIGSPHRFYHRGHW